MERVGPTGMLLSGPERSRGHGCFEPETMRDHGSTPGEGPAGEGPAGRLPPVEETTAQKLTKISRNDKMLKIILSSTIEFCSFWHESCIHSKDLCALYLACNTCHSIFDRPLKLFV